MAEALNCAKERLPCRAEQIEKLYNLFALKDEAYVESIFVYGGPSSGKSAAVTFLMERLAVKHFLVNSMECYSSKILFETILNKLVDHRLDPENPTPHAKCDNMMDFISHLRREARTRDLDNVVMILDNAEELRSMDFNILRGLLRIRELSGVSITIMLISQIPHERYFNKADDVVPMIKIHFPQYNKEQLLEILCLDITNAKNILRKHYRGQIEFDMPFYRNYLNVFLSVFYRACRDLVELKRLSRINFIKYYEPVFSKQRSMADSSYLWRNIAPILKSSLEGLYLRLDSSDSLQNNAQSLELPFYAKYLLIAAYLASYNSPKDDKRLFMKHHGKKKKTIKDAKSKVSKQMNIQLGPKPFTLDRLLAIFYSILDEKVGFNNNFLVQVSSLVELRLLSTNSGSWMLEGQKFKCNVNFEFVHNISKMVGFNVRKYLSDFNN